MELQEVNTIHDAEVQRKLTCSKKKHAYMVYCARVRELEVSMGFIDLNKVRL